MSNVTFKHGSGNTAVTYTVDDVSKGLPVQGVSGGTAMPINLTQAGGTTLNATATGGGAVPVEQIDPITGAPAVIQSTVPVTGYPFGSTPVQASSGNIANAIAAAALPAVAAKTNWVTQIEVTGSGAVAGVPVIVTLAGLLGGTRSFIYSAVAGALLENTPLIIPFPFPLPASAVNTAITLSCPSLGTGNTNNVANIAGFVV